MVNILHTYLILHHYFNSVIEKFKPKPLNLSMSPARFTKVSDIYLYIIYILQIKIHALCFVQQKTDVTGPVSSAQVYFRHTEGFT